uniref:Acid ceramidase n=1 Tax=Hemiscolopendra marginata TaxID=943146 RepID=A0A646QE44_9MYRI
MGVLLKLSTVIFLVIGVSSQIPPYTEECVTNAYPPSSARKVPTYVVNLDLPPEQRWTQLMKDKKEDMFALLNLMKNLTGEFFHGKLFELIDKYLPKLAMTLPYPFPDELKGISNATNIPLGEVTLYNIFYEIFTVCVSIIMQDKNGQLYHGRNLDFGLFMGWDVRNHTWEGTEMLRKLVVMVDFQKGNSTVFRSVHFAGYIGVLSAVKPKLFSLTIDERFQWKGGYIGLIEWVLGFRKGHWMGFLSRNVMEVATSYPEAQMILSKAKLLAPVYFILGGVKAGEGSIITRSFTFVDIWNLGTKNSSWYLVETNYDHWKSPPFYDDRRTPAINCLDKLTQTNSSLAGLFNVLSTKPMLNKMTTYTALMQVSTGHLETYLQYCENPCWPF